MICFHFTIFVVLETTSWLCSYVPMSLWFAFILLSLSYWKQRTRLAARPATCCDLLSFYYLCRTGNNSKFNELWRHHVVICFHFTIFVVLETTVTARTNIAVGLWFAFILLSLSYWKQRCLQQCQRDFRCDLLSFYYLCRTGNNSNTWTKPDTCVVICFHFTIFVVLETTDVQNKKRSKLLWFAFILLSLSYWKQPCSARPAAGSRCDLLSFYYLCRTGNNYNDLRGLLLHVVICFHFTIFVVLETTCRINRAYRNQLWFAFILLSLSYWKQPEYALRQQHRRCDLLSFYYLCRTGNNSKTCNTRRTMVVICFHFTIFVVLETTIRESDIGFTELWFAFILLSLSYWKQRSVRTRRARRVVICFHFTIFVVLETTPSGWRRTGWALWFAFILLSLSYWKQQILLSL